MCVLKRVLRGYDKGGSREDVRDEPIGTREASGVVEGGEGGG